MDQLITNQFRAALTHLLAQEGRGAQARLAKQQDIDRGYLNAIVKGRKSGSEKIRSKIASHFDMAYEDVFVLGRRVLEQAESSAANYENQTFDALTTAEPTPDNTPGDDAIDFKVPAKREGGSSSIHTRILKTIEVLESDTKYGDLLAGLIDAFHDSLSTKREKETIH
jgi:DNA-binding XRE family transcriptional regulator